MRTVRLRKYAPTIQMLQNFGAYRMRFEIVETVGEGLDTNLFLYQRTPATAYDPVPRDYFVAVVSPTQLATTPIGAPVEEVDWPFFRSDSIELDCVSAEQGDVLEQMIKEELSTLMVALNRLDTLEVAYDLWIPTVPPPSDDSESGSSSGSDSGSGS